MPVMAHHMPDAAADRIAGADPVSDTGTNRVAGADRMSDAGTDRPRHTVADADRTRQDR